MLQYRDLVGTCGCDMCGITLIQPDICQKKLNHARLARLQHFVHHCVFSNVFAIIACKKCLIHHIILLSMFFLLESM